MGVRPTRFDVRSRLADGPLYYGWVVVGACFLLGVMTWGTVWSFGVFFGYIVDEFGLSHANTSVIFSLQSVVTFGGAAVLGFVVDRYGARRLLWLAAALVVVGLYAVSQFGSFTGVLLAYGLVVAAGFAIVNVIEKATPSRWFDRRRGVATGVALSGAGVGIAVFPPVVELLIRNLGWRGAYGSLMLAFLLTYVLAALLITDRPGDLDLDPSTEFPAGVPEHRSTDADWRSQVGDVLEVARKPTFGLVFLGTLFFGTAVFVVIVSVVEFTTNVGLGRELGVLAISVAGLMNVVGKLVGGAASDRVGRPLTAASSGLFLAGGTGLLLGVPEPWGVVVAAVVFGFGWGIQIGLLAPLVADLFGTLSINALLGLVLGTAAVAGSLGPYLAGLTFDLFGTYRPAYVGAAVLSVLWSGLVLVAARLETGALSRSAV
jgi:MFS family permease